MCVCRHARTFSAKVGDRSLHGIELCVRGTSGDCEGGAWPRTVPLQSYRRGERRSLHKSVCTHEFGKHWLPASKCGRVEPHLSPTWTLPAVSWTRQQLMLRCACRPPSRTTSCALVVPTTTSLKTLLEPALRVELASSG